MYLQFFLLENDELELVSVPNNRKYLLCWTTGFSQDFLRKNNTGKLLWQALGDQVQLCVCGIELHEDAMWSAFQQAGLILGFVKSYKFAALAKRFSVH